MSVPNWMPLVEDLKKALTVHNRAATNSAVTKLLEMNAPLGEHWRQFAELMRVSGEITLAHRAMDAFVASTGNNPNALYSKAVLHTQSGQMQEAYNLISSLPANIPDPAGHQYVLGSAAMTMGMMDEAREHLIKAVKLKPGWGPAWLTLATTINFATDPLARRLIADRKAAEKQGPSDLARYYFAVGKMNASKGKADATFAAFQKGARLLQFENRYNRKNNETGAQKAMAGFDNGLIEKLNKQKKRDTSRPIFVTGLPRSGTTLVEHILASHSQIANGAELNIIQHLGALVKGNSGQDINTFIEQGGSVDDMASLYLHLLDERFGTSGRIIDKTVDASRALGLIATALPDAPLIWMRRNPLDSAWSCFKTFFIHGVAWSYDLKDIAHHFMLEDQLLAYWQQRLGKRLLVVPYQELVTSPQEWIKRLLVHCGLEEEPGVFNPQDTKRVVLTASALQVRKPINLDGLNVAAPYLKHMQPFIENYTRV